MGSLTAFPVSGLAAGNSVRISHALLSIHFLCAFDPDNSPKTCVNFASRSLFVSRRRSGSGLGFVEVKPQKKNSCSLCGGFLRRCKNGNTGWDTGGNTNLEAEILEFMKDSEKPGMFPTKKDLLRAGRFDLVEGILNQGGWLAMGWDMDKDNIEEEEERTLGDENSAIEKQIQNSCSHDRNLDDAFDPPCSSMPSTSGTSLEVEAECESGIEGILIRLEKERNISFGLNLRKKEKTNGRINTIESSMNMGEEIREKVENKFLERNMPKQETWRTWSMRRAGFSDVNFEAAEFPPGRLGSGNEDGVKEKEAVNARNRTNLKSRLRHLQAELSSVLHSLGSHTDEAVKLKDSEMIHNGGFEEHFDEWELQENEIINARDKLRSTRAKLSVLQGKMAMAVKDAEWIMRAKQTRTDNARRAVRLLRSVCLVWPNSASEVLLSGSFDGWSTQRKMEKSENGVFSLSLKLYPGKYEIKFIVDGEWRVDPLRPIVNYEGYENNVLLVT